MIGLLIQIGGRPLHGSGEFAAVVAMVLLATVLARGSCAGASSASRGSR